MHQIKIILSEEAQGFLASLPAKAQQKIARNILRVEMGVVDVTLFKKLIGSEIWELRTLFSGDCYRLFAFWDTRTKALVIATHGIVKKTNKTPRKEIAKAEAFMKIYFEED